MVVGSNPIAVTQTLDMAPVLREEFLDIQAFIECRFTLKLVRDTIITMHCTDKYSRHSFNHLASLANWLSAVDELSGLGFESRCCH